MKTGNGLPLHASGGPQPPHPDTEQQVARPSRTEISEDAGWLALQALAVIVVFFVGPMVYRNRSKIANRLRQTVSAARRSLRKRRVLRLLRRRSRTELLEIAFCLLAWQEGGFADDDLFFPKPPHYPLDSGTEVNGQNRIHGDFGKSLLLALTRLTREEIIDSVDKSLGKRSFDTLQWLCRRLEDPVRPSRQTVPPDEGTESEDEAVGEISVLDSPLEALNAATTVEEMKTIRDKTRTMEAWCRMADLSLAIQSEYTEIGVRAEREIGRLLQTGNHEGPPGTEGSRPPLGRQNHRFRELSGFRISRREAALWRRLAEIPEQPFEHYLRKARDSGTELTRDGLLGFALGLKREHNVAPVASAVEIVSPAVTVDPAPPKSKPNAGLVLRVGDFREVLRDIPDRSVDAVVTHAPSGLNSFPTWYDLSGFARRVLKPGRLLVAAVSPSDLPHVVQALSASLTYVWVGAVVFRTEAEIVAPYHIRSFHSPVLFFSSGAFEASSWMSDTIWADSEQQRGHEPPQELLGVGAFIGAVTLPGEVVCDPFVGEGLVAMAAQNLGRRFVGCDGDEATVDEIRRRMSTEWRGRTGAV